MCGRLPRGSSRTHFAVVLQGLVRTADPWIRRRRTPPSSCHSLRAENRARTSSRTHLRPRVRPPRVQTARLQVHPRAPGTLIQQAVTYDGDTPRGRVRVLPGGGIRRRRGQQSRPPTRRMPPAAQKCPRTRRMSPAAAPECGASLTSRATDAASRPAPTSNHNLRAPHRRHKRPSKGRRAVPGEEAPSPEVEAPDHGVMVPGPHRSGWLTPIPAARRVRRGPPSAPGYEHRPAPAHCAGGP